MIPACARLTALSRTRIVFGSYEPEETCSRAAVVGASSGGKAWYSGLRCLLGIVAIRNAPSRRGAERGRLSDEVVHLNSWPAGCQRRLPQCALGIRMSSGALITVAREGPRSPPARCARAARSQNPMRRAGSAIASLWLRSPRREPE